MIHPSPHCVLRFLDSRNRVGAKAGTQSRWRHEVSSRMWPRSYRWCAGCAVSDENLDELSGVHLNSDQKLGLLMLASSRHMDEGGRQDIRAEARFLRCPLLTEGSMGLFRFTSNGTPGSPPHQDSRLGQKATTELLGTILSITSQSLLIEGQTRLAGRICASGHSAFAAGPSFL